MINDDVKGSALIRDGRITTSDVQDRAITKEKLADDVSFSLLPIVTKSDSGKVPTVSASGGWEMKAPSGGGGGGGILKVEFIHDSDLSDQYADVFKTTEYTFADLVDAWNAGITIVAHPTMEGEYYPTETIMTCYRETGSPHFCGSQIDGSYVNIVDISETDNILYCNIYLN